MNNIGYLVCKIIGEISMRRWTFGMMSIYQIIIRHMAILLLICTPTYWFTFTILLKILDVVSNVQWDNMERSSTTDICENYKLHLNTNFINFSLNSTIYTHQNSLVLSYQSLYSRKLFFQCSYSHSISRFTMDYIYITALADWLVLLTIQLPYSETDSSKVPVSELRQT